MLKLEIFIKSSQRRNCVYRKSISFPSCNYICPFRQMSEASPVMKVENSGVHFQRKGIKHERIFEWAGAGDSISFEPIGKIGDLWVEEILCLAQKLLYD